MWLQIGCLTSLTGAYVYYLYIHKYCYYFDISDPIMRAFWCVQWHRFSINMFQAVRRAVNVLNVSKCI